MNPEIMNSMLGMLNNPETMNQMTEMMKNPQIQSMMNNPDVMQNMMNMFDIPDMRDNSNVSEDVISDMKQKYEQLEGLEKNFNLNSSNNELNEDKFNPEDIVILNGLKTEKYNEKRGIIQSFNEEKKRYVVLLDEEDIRIMVKEENLNFEITDTDDVEDDEIIVQVD
jgi:hypothetical protein